MREYYGTLIAYAIVARWKDGFLIRYIEVSPHMRGQGLARALLDQMCADADDHGIKLYIDPVALTDEEQQRIEALYRGYNFAPPTPDAFWERQPR